MEDEGTGPRRKEERDPVHYVGGGVALPEHWFDLDGVDIVESGIYGKEEGGAFPAREFESVDLVGEAGDSVCCTKPGE